MPLASSLKIKQAVDLRPLTTFGVGGRTVYYYPALTPEAMIEAFTLAERRGWPSLLLAGGSNVVLPDRAYTGLVVRYYNPAALINFNDQGLVELEVGLPLANLIQAAIQRGWAGLETLSGIPGTVGGAIVGNAGAYGQTISDRLTKVEVYDRRTGRTVWLTKAAGRFAYRDSLFKHQPHLLLLRAVFRLTKGSTIKLAKQAQDIIDRRTKKYPSRLKCPGSFFKNVLVKNVSPRSLKLIDPTKIIDGKIPAGYLLELVGAKGQRQGDVYVADYHGNLLINGGRATFRDVVILANRLKKLVNNKFGITLEEEVRYVT